MGTAMSLIRGDNITDIETAMNTLKELFEHADKDHSGFIDRRELEVLFKEYYKREGTSRNIKAVRNEVTQAMKECDEDGSGKLDFGEFVLLYTSDHFRFNVPATVKEEIRKRGHEIQKAEADRA